MIVVEHRRGGCRTQELRAAIVHAGYPLAPLVLTVTPRQRSTGYGRRGVAVGDPWYRAVARDVLTGRAAIERDLPAPELLPTPDAPSYTAGEIAAAGGVSAIGELWDWRVATNRHRLRTLTRSADRDWEALADLVLDLYNAHVPTAPTRWHDVATAARRLTLATRHRDRETGQLHDLRRRSDRRPGDAILRERLHGQAAVAEDAQETAAIAAARLHAAVLLADDGRSRLSPTARRRIARYAETTPDLIDAWLDHATT
ncbi:hypothetical protein ACFRCG_40010 [Embleya sp. NPDC056575]|uniref:hypothetical protein n=1 Tax=unclassified Embleya TaxID=2699296 RepID=UPI0036C12826